MTRLAQALQVSFQYKTDEGSFYYCELDPNWAVMSIPQGGYSLGLMIEACIHHQSGTLHVDPVYISTHFLRPANTGAGQVRVKLLKSGKTFTNLVAELVQQGAVKTTAHLVFGDLSPSQPSRGQKVLTPPSPYARRVPLYSHPSTVSYDATKPLWARTMEFHMSVDAILLSRNEPDSATRTTVESVGGGGTEWGAWCELAREGDRLTMSCIPFFCDASTSLPDLLPTSEPGSRKGKSSRFPTIAMTVEFKARVPSSDSYSTRTLGLYTESRFQTDPDGRHNARVEVWTAPCEIGQGDVADAWRDHQYCIAVADQMALVIPQEEPRTHGDFAVKL